MNLKNFYTSLKLERLKEEYLAKSPLEKWLFVREINLFSMNMIGVGFMDVNYKLQWKTWIPIYLLVNYYSLMFYTCYYYWNEPVRAIEATIINGIMGPVR